MHSSIYRRSENELTQTVGRNSRSVGLAGMPTGPHDSVVPPVAAQADAHNITDSKPGDLPGARKNDPPIQELWITGVVMRQRPLCKSRGLHYSIVCRDRSYRRVPGNREPDVTKY